MELTKKQAEGLEIAIKRYYDKEQYTIIGGYAGTGKTTLIKAIIAKLPSDLTVSYACFTGKAASVLTRKGNKNATTLHKLLYHTKKTRDGEFVYIPREKIDADVVVVDECSMLPGEMIRLLLSYGVYVLFTGDPGQLPPINENDANHLLDNPHIFLDEVMRQATESDIIRISMDVREGRGITAPYTGKDVRIFNAKDMDLGTMFSYFNWGDEILVGTNACRRSINNAMRAFYGREGEPQNGDKVICLKNNWEEYSSDNNPLANGTVGYLRDIYTSYARYNIAAHKEGPNHINYRAETLPYIRTNFETDFGDIFPEINIDKKMLETGSNGLSPQDCFMIERNKKNPDLPIPFEYGYAITVHKAQGSQWEKVVVINEKFPYQKDEHIRWLYTAITRAEKKLVIINAPEGLDKYLKF